MIICKTLCLQARALNCSQFQREFYALCVLYHRGRKFCPVIC